MNDERLPKVVEGAMNKGVFSACVIGVVENGLSDVRSFGEACEDSIFDVASVTKVVPTSTLALKLIDEGRIKLDDKLIDYVPEFANSDRENVKIFHLLTQGLDYDFRLSDYKNLSADEILNVIFTTEFKSLPGEKYYYTNATSILLGLVVENVYGGALDEIATREIFEPLEMNDTSFHPEDLDFERIIATEFDDWRGREIRGEVHDESSWKLREKIVAGAAGVFSTAPDLLKFLEAILKKALPSSLGWETSKPYMGDHHENRIGKTGFTGSVIMIDKALQKGLVILTNYTYPKRKPDLPKGRNDFFKEVANIIFEDKV
ncbi:MAG: serine hydrolase domain-containing protein [Candidatus Peregrinibacteria bacterium]|nr:serine hydrolase domain-containing protein [Candidatus Peregrinibacteria bacterium]MDZ4244673.1 serine hydrolase domain-containing protein [Candidatus Gracilibacteria bacterium]